MLFSKTSVFVALLAIFVSPADCTPVQETNARRMARGLPPRAPKFGRNLPGMREIRQATPVAAAKRATASSSPPVIYTGRIQARNEDGSALGVVRNSNSSWTIGGLNFLGSDQDLQVSITVPGSGGGQIDILATNPLFSQPYYVGAAGTTAINTLDLTSKNTISFTNVQQTPQFSTPVVSTFDHTLVVESSIWSINQQTKELTAQWINPDQSKPATTIAYNIRSAGAFDYIIVLKFNFEDLQNTLFFVGSITSYNENNNTLASAVKLFLV